MFNKSETTQPIFKRAISPGPTPPPNSPSPPPEEKKKKKRRRRRERDDRSETLTSDDESDEREHKRSKPDLEVNALGRSIVPLEDSGLPEKHHELFIARENHSRDPKEVLRRYRADPEFPSFTNSDTIWYSIILDGFVDLDAVCMERYSRKIETYLDWNNSFLDYQRAVEFAFTRIDRRRELDTYHQYIQSLFYAYNENLAHNIIALDRQLCTLIGSSGGIRFDDTSNAMFQNSYLTAEGSQFKPARNRDQRVGRAPREGKSATTGTKDPVATVTPARESTNAATAATSTVYPKASVPAPQSDPRLPARTTDEVSGHGVEERESRLPAGFVTLTQLSRFMFGKHKSNLEDALQWESEPSDSDSNLPRYLRGFGWNSYSVSTSHTARCTEVDNPLPRPPASEGENEGVTRTINENPHLFHVSTEINVPRLQDLLHSHPNQPFVESVVQTLTEGAWPFADTRYNAGFPLTWDNSCILPKSERERDFLEDQSQKEEEAGRYSPDFGPDLLPGMYSTPALAVPKPHSDDFRLCSHMSAGEYCQNNMMDKKETKGARLDTILHLIAALLLFRRLYPTVRLVLWKSDVANAFRLIPSHPYWQIKQIITTNYPTKRDREEGIDRGPLRRRVDWRSSFGSCGSPRLWNSIMGLVIWIAIYVRSIVNIFTYVDDTFGWEVEGKLTFYNRYQKMMPTKQVEFLHLLDYLGIPHKEGKQLWGPILVIIGFQVDVNAMTVTLPTQSKADLIQAVEDFLKTPTRKRTLHDWLQLSGWISWSFNVFPLLRPALCHVYKKTSAKSNSFATVYINQAVHEELTWFLNHVYSAPLAIFRLPGVEPRQAVTRLAQHFPTTSCDNKDTRSI